MNPIDPHDTLIDALLAERATLDTMQSAGLAELRRQRWRRRLFFVASGAAAAMLIFAFAQISQRDRTVNVQVPFEPKTEIAESAPIVAPTAAGELTDDELISQFPPGTCTIAEIAGRKMLVFLTAEAQAKYLR